MSDVVTITHKKVEARRGGRHSPTRRWSHTKAIYKTQDFYLNLLFFLIRTFHGHLNLSCLQISSISFMLITVNSQLLERTEVYLNIGFTKKRIEKMLLIYIYEK